MQPALVTGSNSGIPAGLKKALDAVPDDVKGHAAGILYVAPDGDVLMLRRSSAESNYAGHWALPGGGVEPGETPEAGALRESREEMGVDAEGQMKPLDRRITPTGMAFHTFAFPTKSKFVPKLNEEHSGYAWAPLDQLPGPLHPAVAQTLKDRIGVGAEDMTPESWSGLRKGFLEWTIEEQREPEHAGDMALDRGSVRSYDKDGRLHVEVANLSKACVNPYKGSEIPDYKQLGLDPDRIYQLYRDPEELEKGAPTFNGIQVLQKHTPVNADDHQPYDTVGATMDDAVFDAPYLKNGLSIWARDAISGIESGKQVELSCGYRYRADMTAGNIRGMRFDGVMRDIVGNHVALVEDGRAGPDVVVGDSSEGLSMSAVQASKAIMARATSIAALNFYLKPRIATDAKPDFAKIFDGVSCAKFKDMRSTIAQRIVEQLKPKLAQDASLNDVEKVLGMLEKHEVEAGDATVTPEQNAEMGAASGSVELPAMPAKDAGEEGLRGFLKKKGMGEDDINAACGMMKNKASDEDPEEKKKREKDEADKKAQDEADKSKAEEDKKKAEDAMKDMVTKPAMDAAIAAATTAATTKARETERGIRIALDSVRPYVGELPASMAFDTGADVMRHALGMLGVKEAKNLHESALQTILDLQPKPGARPAAEAHLALDSAQTQDISKRFPGIERIGVG